jgi:uncharacterized protein (TIGR02300 family)
MYDKAKLGTRYACFQCGTKFYDLNRPEPFCPECGADQREAPARDIRALLSGKGRVRDDEDESIPDSIDGEGGEDDDEFDDLGLDEDEEEEEGEEDMGGGGEDW